MAHPVQNFFQKFGFNLSKPPQHNGQSQFELDGFTYGFVSPNANYAPWRGG